MRGFFFWSHAAVELRPEALRSAVKLLRAEGTVAWEHGGIEAWVVRMDQAYFFTILPIYKFLNLPITAKGAELWAEGLIG